MVEMVTGVPGSGKTSYAITRLAKTFSKNEDLKKKIPKEFLIPDVDKAFTNINELKIKELNNVRAIHFDDLVSKLTILEEKVRKDKWEDEQLIELATEYGINNSMFIIDECHNYFDVPKKVLTWWLSYHRHLHQHIILLTQNLSLINAKYKAFPEIYLKAIPGSLKLFNNSIILKKYTNSRLSKNAQAGQTKVKKFQEVFDLYGSGANHKSKSVILPYVIGALSLLILIFFYFKFGYKSEIVEAHEEQKNITSNQITKKIGKQKDNTTITFNEMKYLTVICNQNECYYKDIIFSKKLLNIKYGAQILFNEKITNNNIKYTILLPLNIYSSFDIETKNFILGVKDNENKTNSSYYNITK